MLTASNIKLFTIILLFTLTFFIIRAALGFLPAILISAFVYTALYLLRQASNRVFYSSVLLGLVASGIAYQIIDRRSLPSTQEPLAGNWQSETGSLGMGIYFWGDSVSVSQVPYEDTVTFFSRLDTDTLRLYQDSISRFAWKIRITGQNQWQMEQGDEIISFLRNDYSHSHNNQPAVRKIK